MPGTEYKGPNPLNAADYDRLSESIREIDELLPLCRDCAECGANTQGYADACGMMRSTAETILGKFFPAGRPE